MSNKINQMTDARNVDKDIITRRAIPISITHVKTEVKEDVFSPFSFSFDLDKPPNYSINFRLRIVSIALNKRCKSIIIQFI